MTVRLLLALSLSLPLAAQHICLAEGTAGSLRIATVPESSPNASDTVVVDNVELLPLEITGRTLAREFDPSRSRRSERNGIQRVELPGGGGLLRYKRNGGQHWGFLRIAADGSTQVALELPGIGLTDPFFDQIAVSDDGLHGAFALLAGGIHAVKLDGTVYPSTGRPDRLAAPVSHVVEPTSLMVGSTHVFYVTGTDRLYRCSLADNAVPVDLTPPTSPNDRLKDELAMSRDGLHLVFLHGPQNLQRLWHVSATGAATMLPPPASKYEEPNYLPGGAGEPAMLLSDDGSRLFYVDSLVRDELYLLDLQGTLPTLQITDDPIFQPYIGVHILPKFRGPDLLIAIGDPGQMDWFAASLAAPGGTVNNLTGTGSNQQPYPAGTLDPTQAADAGSQLLVLEQRAGGMDLRRLDVATGASAIVHSDPLLTLAVGSSFTTAVDTVVQGSAGDRLYAGSASALLGATPSGVGLTAPVTGIVSATWVHLVSSWGAPVFYLPDGTTLPGQFAAGEPQIVMTANDGIVLNGATLRYITFGVDVVVQRPSAAVRVVLSGAGG